MLFAAPLPFSFLIRKFHIVNADGIALLDAHFLQPLKQAGSCLLYTSGDVDPACIAIAQANARRAHVENQIRFEVADARKFYRQAPGGLIVSNPPYGERVMERADAERLYRQFGAAVKKLEGWKFYLLSSHTEFERNFGKTADKKRKLYNGMIKCDLFMYF